MKTVAARIKRDIGRAVYHGREFVARMSITSFIALGLAAAAIAQEPNALLRTPRATVRTLFVATELARESPHYVETATRCLDLAGSHVRDQDAGVLAVQLEAILRAHEIHTRLIPDDASLPSYSIVLSPAHRLTLRRNNSGSFLFDADSLALIPKLWVDAHHKLQTLIQESAALNVTPRFSTPRATMRTFFVAVHRQDTHSAIACLDLNDIPSVARAEVGAQLVLKLVRVINRIKLVILQDIQDTNYSIPFVFYSQPTGVIELSRQSAGDRKGEWLFSAATVQSIDNLYDVFENEPVSADVEEMIHVRGQPDFWHSPDLWLRAQLPDWCLIRIFATKTIHIEVYELIGNVLLIVTCIGVFRLADRFLVRVIELIFGIFHLQIPRPTLRARLRPTARLVSVAYLRWGVLLLSMDKVLLVPILTVINPLLWILGALALFRGIDLIGDAADARLALSKHRALATQMLMPVGSLALKIVICVSTLFHLMHLFSWEISAVLTGLGIGGLAFALGAQDSLKNLFGSFTLIADRPFVVGERVKIGERGEGVVEIVGLRSTRIRTLDGALLTVPNSDLTTAHITNYGQRRFSRLQTTFGVNFTTPADRLLAFRDGIHALLQQFGDNKESTVAIHELGPAAVVVQVTVVVEVADDVQERKVREDVIVAIMRLAESLQISFAKPT